MKLDREKVINSCRDTIPGIMDAIGKLPEISLKELTGEYGPEGTVLVVVDMINGFAREGALKSDRVEAIIPEIEGLSRKCDSMGIRKLAFADCHTEASLEFGAYPVHCIKGTGESEMVDELKNVGRYHVIPKNSTNGFLEEEFQQWLRENGNVRNFILVGDCTDICIEQFAVSLKAYFNIRDIKSRIIVPVNAVDTYDTGLHNAELMNIMALFTMMGNGVELAAAII